MTGFLESVSYRDSVALTALNASTAVMHYPKLLGNSDELTRTEEPVTALLAILYGDDVIALSALSAPSGVTAVWAHSLSWNQGAGCEHPPPSRCCFVGLDPMHDSTFEKHYTIQDLRKQWAISRDTIRRLVADEPGVIRMQMGAKKALCRYSVPESVARRIHTRLTAGRLN